MLYGEAYRFNGIQWLTLLVERTQTEKINLLHINTALLIACVVLSTILQNNLTMKKTSKEWYSEIPKEHKVVILDPDGWDRRNYEYSFNEELITKEEFKMRTRMSTVQCNHSFFTADW